MTMTTDAGMDPQGLAGMLEELMSDAARAADLADQVHAIMWGAEPPSGKVDAAIEAPSSHAQRISLAMSRVRDAGRRLEQIREALG